MDFNIEFVEQSCSSFGLRINLGYALLRDLELLYRT